MFERSQTRFQHNMLESHNKNLKQAFGRHLPFSKLLPRLKAYSTHRYLSLVRIKKDPNFKACRRKLSIEKDEPIQQLIDIQRAFKDDVTEDDLDDVLTNLSAVLRSKNVLQLPDLLEEFEDLTLKSSSISTNIGDGGKVACFSKSYKK